MSVPSVVTIVTAPTVAALLAHGDYVATGLPEEAPSIVASGDPGRHDRLRQGVSPPAEALAHATCRNA